MFALQLTSLNLSFLICKLRTITHTPKILLPSDGLNDLLPGHGQWRFCTESLTCSPGAPTIKLAESKVHPKMITLPKKGFLGITALTGSWKEGHLATFAQFSQVPPPDTMKQASVCCRPRGYPGYYGARTTAFSVGKCLSGSSSPLSRA